jgi:hypothetical protein
MRKFPFQAGLFFFKLLDHVFFLKKKQDSWPLVSNTWDKSMPLKFLSFHEHDSVQDLG